jgi:hypothetical protein
MTMPAGIKRDKRVRVIVLPPSRETEACISLLLLTGWRIPSATIPITGTILVAEVKSVEDYRKRLDRLHSKVIAEGSKLLSTKSIKFALSRCSTVLENLSIVEMLLDLGRRGLTIECEEFLSIQFAKPICQRQGQRQRQRQCNPKPQNSV